MYNIYLTSLNKNSIKILGYFRRYRSYLTNSNGHCNNSSLSTSNMSSGSATNNNSNNYSSMGANTSQQSNTNDPNREDGRLTESYYATLSNISATLLSSLKWCPTSEKDLEAAEGELLSALTKPYETYFVDIGPGWGNTSNKIRTIASVNIESKAKRSERNTESDRQPLVMIHGFAAGVGTWILNLDTLSSTLNRKIYAIDLIGFGRSSRAPFDLSNDVEGQFVDSIERWRAKLGLNKFILLGHSFGGYLCGCYALRHPERVSQVIFADPWGIQDRQATSTRTAYRFPLWVRLANSIFQSFNPLAVLRASGPYGPRLVHKFRADLREKFRPKLEDDCDKFLSYIYHCNAQSATGESAFKALALPYGWPKNPLIHRLLNMDESIFMTFIYGSRSWIEKAPGEFLRDCLTSDRVAVHIIQGSGHHVYADKYKEFNDLVKEACDRITT